jgi:hypothetical protein
MWEIWRYVFKYMNKMKIKELHTASTWESLTGLNDAGAAAAAAVAPDNADIPVAGTGCPTTLVPGTVALLLEVLAEATSLVAGFTLAICS